MDEGNVWHGIVPHGSRTSSVLRFAQSTFPKGEGFWETGKLLGKIAEAGNFHSEFRIPNSAFHKRR